MADIQVTTNQSVIEVTQNNGITVTTPTGQVIDVTVPSSDVNVTTTTDNITVLTNGTLNITTGITDRLVAGSNQVILNTDATMSFPNNAIDFGNQSADLKSSSYSELWYHTANPTPTAGQGIQTYIWGWENQAGIAVESLDENGANRYLEWYFNANGTTTFPTLTVPVNDVGYTDVTGQVLKFSDPNKQAIIYGPAATTGSAQRMLLQGAPGADGSTGEGGDVYIWAGRGGSVVDAVGGGDGGDVKVRAGQGRGGASGGYVRIQGGDSDGGVGGFVDIQGGDGTGDGGYTRILSSVNTERIKVDAAGVKFNSAYTFPNADGTADQVMKTDGLGNLSFYSPSDLNTTYNIDATSTTGGANFNLNGSDSTTDSIKIAAGTNITVTATDANTITIDGTDLNTTYTISSASTTGGANLTLTGSDTSTDSVAYKGSGATTVTSTDVNTITISSTDTNTTYTQNFSSVSGGTNLNLVGSDSTTDTVKFANGTGVTVTRTDADTATIAIGQDVATSANPTFAGVTGGNVTVGVDTDQTISTSSGNLILQTATGTNAGTMTFTAGTNGAITLAPNGSGSVAVNASSGITTNQTTFPLVNTTATTINMGGAATSNNIGAKTGGSSIISGTNRYTSPIAYNIGTAGAIPHRGLMISNGNAASNAVARTASVLRVFPTGAVGPRGGIFVEAARGNETTPTALQTNDLFGEFVGSGYATNSWVNDLIALPASTYFYAAENWVNTGGPAPTAGTVTNSGSGYIVSLQPTATNLTANGASRISVLDVTPQTFNTRSDGYNFKSKANTNLVTIASDGQLQVFNTNATANNNIYGYRTKVLTSTTENANGNNIEIKPGKLTGSTGFDKQTQISVIQNTTDGSVYANLEVKTQRFDGTNYSPTQSGDNIGRFLFNGNYVSGTTPAVGNGNSLNVTATEAWTSGASGTKINLNITKTGTNTGLTVLEMGDASSTFKSDSYTFQNSAGTTLATISASTANFTVPVTTEITSTTISEGTTYTPAATVDNNISVQINTLSGGTTVIDLASLTGNTRGGSYNILVFNNTASGTPLNVINSRISGSNLMSHTITTGSPRIIINAYVVGNYATATHLVVA